MTAHHIFGLVVLCDVEDIFIKSIFGTVSLDCLTALSRRHFFQNTSFLKLRMRGLLLRSNGLAVSSILITLSILSTCIITVPFYSVTFSSWSDTCVIGLLHNAAGALLISDARRIVGEKMTYINCSTSNDVCVSLSLVRFFISALYIDCRFVYVHDCTLYRDIQMER